MSKFEMRLRTIGQALAAIPSCPCHQRKAMSWCEACEAEGLRDSAIEVAASMRAALDADEMYNR